MDPGGAVARPFLSVSRATVREALRIWRQDYRDDSSNTAPRFTRNRLRRDVMPLLEHFNPRVAERLAHTAEILRRDANFIEMETNRVLASLRVSTRAGAVSASRAGWGALHLALAATVARRLIEMVLGDVQDVEERHVASLIQAVQVGRPARLELPRGLRVEIAPRIVTLSVGLTDRESIPLRPTPLGVPGTLELETGTLTARELFQTDAADIARFIVVAGPNHALLDADAAGADLAIRSRSPGDRVKPAGTEVTRKLQDILVDARVPRARRDSIPVVTNGKHILWVPGLAVDRRASATPSSTRILHLVWTPNSARIP
jgi:tRNA(Ile)-lysidine synthetase-like protein